MALNQNYPVLEYGWGPRWNVNAATVPLDQYVDITAKTRGAVALSRGRQYELDQVRAGSYTHAWVNNDGAFDPNNASGPWYGHVQLFQPLRIRAQWPPTQNLLTPVQATGGDSGGYSTGTIPQGNTGIAVASATDSSGGTITTSGTAWQGSTVFQFTVPASTASGTSICATSQPAVTPGQPYSVQLRVRDVTASTSLSVAAYIAWYDASGALLSTTVGGTSALTGGTSASWTQVTASGTAPATTAYATSGVRTAATSPGSSVSAQVDGWQFEQAAAPTTWTAPGTWYPLYSGFVDRYPQQWAMSGTYGTVQPEAYDAFTLLSQRLLRDPLVEEIYKRTPRFVYTLGDPQGSSSVADSAGNMPLAQVATSKRGAGSLVFGTQITAANPTTGVYTGSTSTVATFANPNPGTATASAATYIELTTAGITGPSGTSWSRAIAFRYTGAMPVGAGWAAIWTGFARDTTLTPFPSGARCALYIDVNGHLNANVTDDNSNGGTSTVTSVNVADSNWHLAIFGAKAGQQFLSVDGGYSGGATSYGTQTTLVKDSIGAWVDPSIGYDTPNNYAGDISFACEWPSYLTSTDCTAIYGAWRNSFTGDNSATRYARILGWAGYTGPTSIQTGNTTSMGPATVDGQDVLSALQAVVDTENGTHFVARDGTITFKARSDRYNKLTPTYTFGEQEYPYESFTSDLDVMRVANIVQITQQSTSQVFTAQDKASITANRPRQLTRTVNTTSSQECLDAANYLLSRYKQATTRVSSLRLHPSANTQLWPVCLALELGTRIRVVRRPPGAGTITLDCFIEQITWSIDDQGEVFVDLQCSPADLTPYGLWAALHTTLNGSPTSGVTTITINAPADNQSPAAAQLCQGQQLVLGLNTANQETVTVKTVAATSAGWTTATVTLQAATTKSHTSGDTVCEPLPSGVTDPTTWDASSKFDSLLFAY